MRDWLPHKLKFLDEIMELEAPRTADRICSKCNTLTAFWWCKNCFGSPEYCTACCRNLHLQHPFHRVEFWMNGYYAPAWLQSAGVFLALGHGGKLCPTISSDNDINNPLDISEDDSSDDDFIFNNTTTNNGNTNSNQYSSYFNRQQKDSSGNPILTIVDTSGVHRIGIKQCFCPGSDSLAIQLLKMGLYPASIASPRTAFTFHVRPILDPGSG